MKDGERQVESLQTVARTNWTMVTLIGALVLLALMVIYLATRGNGDEDKLTNRVVDTGKPALQNGERLCASSATYDLIKRELFRRAAQLRGNDQPAFERILAVSVLRMENPVMESQDPATSAVNCSGSLALDLPPGVQVIGGRRTLSSDLDYTVTTAADGSGPVVLLKNPDALVAPLATLAQAPQEGQGPSQHVASEIVASPESNTVVAVPPSKEPGPSQPVAAIRARPQIAAAQPSFDCTAARTRGEIAVCSDQGLAALDRQMAQQYSRALSVASPDERDVLRQTAHRFYAYRDRCPDNACIADAYTGRIREIRDIVEGRWQPPQ